MKIKTSISIDKETLKRVEEAIENKKFRNKSHAFENCVMQILNGDEQ